MTKASLVLQGLCRFAIGVGDELPLLVSYRFSSKEENNKLKTIILKVMKMELV